MVHILKVTNIPLNMEEDDIIKVLKYVKVEEIDQVKVKTKERVKTNEIKKYAYIYCDKVSKIFKIGGIYKFKYKSNDYEISYYKEK